MRKRGWKMNDFRLRKKIIDNAKTRLFIYCLIPVIALPAILSVIAFFIWKTSLTLFLMCALCVLFIFAIAMLIVVLNMLTKQMKQLLQEAKESVEDFDEFKRSLEVRK